MCGDEDFLQDRYVASRKLAWKNRYVVTKEASEVSESELVGLCETRSFFDDGAGRAVILDNAQDFKSEKALEEYVQERNASDLSSILLVIIRGTKIPAMWTSAAKKGATVSFMKFRPWETAKVFERIHTEAERVGVKLDTGVVEVIHKYLGDNLRDISNELIKLSYVLGSDQLVKKEHLAKLLTPNIEIEPRHIAEAALTKNRKLAADRLSKMFKAQGESACVSIISSCLYQVEKTLIARQMLDHGDAVATIAQRFGMNEYACKLNVIPIAQKHTVKSLLGHMNHLCKLDAQVKGAARSKRTLVELAVLSIAA